MDEALLGRQVAAEGAVAVLGIVGRGAGRQFRDREPGVADRCLRGDDPLAEGLLVDEWLGRGTDLPRRDQGAVVFALGEVAPADDGRDAAGGVVDGKEGGLKRFGGLGRRGG